MQMNGGSQSCLHMWRKGSVYKTWEISLQDFTEGSDIDWSKSVAEIDAQLYAKYGLSDDEIAFIESMIKPM